ncbi:IstB-like ATP binding N-terminal [Desulforamulus putei DSM 12395]|uniref:IstB-like ATP binding N-terminal n=1 Tax=Desulforamulus putei DSM 12395 TaxID=1121429 RepID=A0A1M5D5A4_9FIRM|nr:ATP-binding protein [Desulforamulus putei]SHF62035.1 IstB-like ATP binding N-terminal [Desulforamulus putei DSM 12395]
MLNDNTVSKLHEMRLSVMAQAFREQLKDSSFHELSFEERLGLLVDAEWAVRKNNRMARLIKKADYAM